ncbi:MAG TPA: hypothetical protein VG125_18410 [Pirellulales bacterium]|jgi:hypothetical protein|nr:hypothetical protein [Pirellulales bacterium]
MSNLQRFERLVEVARAEPAPRIDVTARVANTVELLAAESFKYRPAASLWADSPLLAFAGFSLAAAALVFVFALPCWESVQDPLVAFCKPLSAIFE